MYGRMPLSHGLTTSLWSAAGLPTLAKTWVAKKQTTNTTLSGGVYCSPEQSGEKSGRGAGDGVHPAHTCQVVHLYRPFIRVRQGDKRA